MEDFKVSKIKKIVAYLLTLAMLISVFNFTSFASKADETVDESTLITSEESSDEIDETSENTTGEITEEPENIPEYLSETSTEDVTEDLIEDETTETTEDVTEEVLDNTEEVTEITTEEEVTEDESPYLYLKMSEGGSIRFNNATYSVDDDILYKDLVEYARPNNLGYFKIDEDLTSVSVIALAELNGTISDFKVSSYDGSNFTLLYQGNSGIDCQMKKTINISDDTYLDIVFIEGDNVCINDDNMLNGARETTTPTGYLPVADFTVTVTEDSRTPQRIVYKTDKQKKYYLRITKIDKMTNNPIFDNSATYKIWSYADNDYVSFRTYTGSRFENISEFKTAEDGILITPGTLVYGDYRIDEIKTPDNYNNDSPDGIDFTIDDYTIYVTYEEAGDTAVGLVDIVFKDTSYLGQIKINKSAEVREFDDEKHEYAVIDTIPLKDIEFGIYAAEDIISQDGHNVVLYSKGDLIETIVTDEDGYAESTPLLPLGKYVVVEENTPEDYIKAEDIDVIISSQGELKELDYNMEKIKVDIHEYDVLNKTKIPTISTFASDGATNSHVGTVGEEVTINDVCKMTGLIPGRKYAVDGYQMVVETKLPFLDDGKPVTSYCEFVATDEEMEITMPYTLDSSQLEGKTLNTYENLYEMGDDDTDENNKKKVAEHHVLEDENQNIHYPDIKTSVKDNITGTHIGTVSRNVTITDSCECTNLVIGKKYKIYGKQMVVETGKPLLDNGKEVTSEKSFVATEKNMTIDLSYTFDSSALAGKVINTFEWLYTDDINVNSHTDLTDEEQNLEFKEIQVKLIKKDKFEDTKTLPGVTFVLFKKSDSIIKNTDDELIEFSEQLTDDDKKYAEEYKLKADDLFIGKYVTDENGEIFVDNLTLGDYYFVETETLYR